MKSFSSHSTAPSTVPAPSSAPLSATAALQQQITSTVALVGRLESKGAAPMVELSDVLPTLVRIWAVTTAADEIIGDAPEELVKLMRRAFTMTNPHAQLAASTIRSAIGSVSAALELALIAA